MTGRPTQSPLIKHTHSERQGWHRLCSNFRFLARRLFLLVLLYVIINLKFRLHINTSCFCLSCVVAFAVVPACRLVLMRLIASFWLLLFSSFDFDSMPLFTNFFSYSLSLASSSESSLLSDKSSDAFAGFLLGALGSSPVLPFFCA